MNQGFAVRVPYLAAALLVASLTTVWRAEAANLCAGERPVRRPMASSFEFGALN